MSIRVAINGFGRIGRNVLRAATQSPDSSLQFVAVNDLTDSSTLAHLLKYDSVHGRYPGTVEVSDDGLIVDGDEIRVLSRRDPADLPWRELAVDVVVESTGRFRTRELASRHLAAGASKVVISAPAKAEDITIVLGVNDHRYDPDRHHVISNASCTTNCLAPVAKVLTERFGFVRGLMTTIHAYTAGQAILDGPHKDLRRARAAAVSMIPTTTGAARAISLVLPELEGKLDGMAIRVPTPDVSVVDLVAEIESDATPCSLNDAFRAAAETDLAGILRVEEQPLVSVDFTGEPASSVVDAGSTAVMDRRMVKVLAWYDNEWGYSSRVVDLVQYVGERLAARV
ncbi:MAG: type I glyceraldehyde-3-phosphate dehydrogenase [Gemmatimonadota bacterium]|nr:type I glyceraldehyde-3-phosphate dehydrogenase [Gemmatimonadota bacterium]MDE2864829.1 type I glyceraldehyde-3-phosphate dehydrogenase [Gemmatimonadota bacterium]MXV96863.1 type I glyceraldehyde-3-phosphate dehydrogenase [Gemmatimonadota bacterium]MYB05813.1 type I glyceraldehyde-3-phosphate dehydrogenase [Gemmatimonadota bacterium]MYE15507.1 type I glyceraldehyde-3-phosphate dehydrogenase [Gemmatimonadota bacterium]